ncbi:DUF4169 family protein [Hyphomonas oceanitis]|uniref:DUF4169 family protein n=1 Tax=Hyphomonas oceanitis TaxID=81033 RepID=UPI003002F01F
MTTPINLNKARKAKARSAKEQAAAENRAKFGRTKVEKSLEQARAEKLTRLTEGHRLDGDPDKQG